MVSSTGGGDEGDIAIDHIQMTLGTCEELCEYFFMRNLHDHRRVMTSDVVSWLYSKTEIFTI